MMSSLHKIMIGYSISGCDDILQKTNSYNKNILSSLQLFTKFFKLMSNVNNVVIFY